MAVRSALINVMIGAVRKAARALIRDFGEVQHLQVSKKGPADFVSAADRHAEDILYNELRKVRPAYGLLMEERGVVEGTDTSNRWLIDPLDGTTNFLHGLPHFAISVALERDGNLIAGVVYEPIHDEMFWAEKGGGAYLNDRRIRVSARRQMDESIFATVIPLK
ncbi:MAG TPA: inositol monophosphatase family protein, partial [Rhodospirillales bacterium]|nr:inositol monophosphatase family protein [Rhodospirillales bacterium]